MPKFHNADGQLSAYALALGYIQSEPAGAAVRSATGQREARYCVTLSQASPGEWHVKVSDARLPFGLAAWEAFDSLTAARRAWKRAVKHYWAMDPSVPAMERDKSANATRPDWAH